MNKTAIKNFAVWARNKLIAETEYKASLLGITEKGVANALPQSGSGVEYYDVGTKTPYAVTGNALSQRRNLVAKINEKAGEGKYAPAYHFIMEEVAYTWFNRLIAVRFMEVNDYLPSRTRALSSADGRQEPQLVTSPFDAVLDFTEDERAQIVALKNENKLDEAFNLLFLKQCNALNASLPMLFEKTADYTELLLNLTFTDKDGVVYHLVNDIAEDDWRDAVQIIGWLYQYYNTEPKDKVFADLKKNIKINKDTIPAATQLFTPDWIVRYMVENSLGRLWLEGHPNAELQANWKYYLPEAEQTPEVQAKLKVIRTGYATLQPEDIKVIDPCMGSGHILVYAFDVLMQIYESAGYSQRDAAASILQNNLYGLDIDDRAAQLAYFAVMMKARQYNRRVLNGAFKPRVYSIQESNTLSRVHLKYFGHGMDDMERHTALLQMQGLLDTLTDAKEYGSILNVESYNWELLRRFVASADVGNQISFDSNGLEETKELAALLVEQGEVMAQKYDAVVTNPPYMGLTNTNSSLNDYATAHFSQSKTDLYSIFIEKCSQMIETYRFMAMICQQSWMYLPSFKEQRIEMCNSLNFVNLAQQGARGFDEISGEVVTTVSFVFRKNLIPQYVGCYINLSQGQSECEKEQLFCSGLNRYFTNQESFALIPNQPIAYDISERAASRFQSEKPFIDFAVAKPGLQTSDNERFLRIWPEIDFHKIGFSLNHADATKSDYKWFPYNKGIGFRKWYGNNDYVLNYYHDGEELKYWLVHNPNDPKTKHWSRNMRNYDYYFCDGITFTAIGSSFSGRKNGEGYLFDTKGPMMFGQHLDFLCGFVNSVVFDLYNRTLCKQITKTADSVNQVPVCLGTDSDYQMVCQSVDTLISISKSDWDSFENSWDFAEHPLVTFSKGLWDATCVAASMHHFYGELPKVGGPLELCSMLWQGVCNERFTRLKANEEELNRVFIDIYGLQDELTPEVEEKDVTVRRADLGRDIRSLISYAVGCMFGRYSLDVPGLAYAGGAWDESKYKTFTPDADNCIPITDEAYFEDDIVGRFEEFIKTVYGADTLEQNLDFIAKALGNKGGSSREIIRNYFLSDFFADHCKTYSVTGSGKRPIYWLYDSGKQNGFKALVYMHRYNADTTGLVRVDYLHKTERVYEREITRMQETIDSPASTGREVAAATKRKEKLVKQLKECKDYDVNLGHLALARIAIDLDDGVKVNYEKIQTDADGKKYPILARI